VFGLRVVSPSHRLGSVPLSHPQLGKDTFHIPFDIIIIMMNLIYSTALDGGRGEARKAQGETVHILADEHFESTGHG